MVETQLDMATEDGEEYLDQEDMTDQQDRMEDQSEEVESAEWADIPQRRKQDSLYTLFNKVWRALDSSKVANLHKDELGKYPLMTVRDAQYLALLGTTLKHKKFAQFFKNAGEITLATSASKKGWFTELFVSQKKFTSRASQFGHSPDINQNKKTGLFGSGGGGTKSVQDQAMEDN